MSGERPRWRARPEGLRFGSSLTLSFQRYLVADAPALPDIPKSLGALEPAELERGVFLVPVHDAEAVWLGIELLKAAEVIRLLVGQPPEWHEFVFGSSASRSIEMIAALPGPLGALRFGPLSTQCASVSLVAAHKNAGQARVAFVDPPTFERLTGHPPPAPARREDGYGDWRLP